MDESYETRVKDAGKSYEVFSNPSFKEMKELSQNGLGIKFIADNKKKLVFVWDVYGPLHGPTWHQLNSADLSDDIYDGRILPGYARLIKGKAIMSSLDGNSEFEFYVKEKEISVNDVLKKWRWVEKYIKISDNIKRDLK